MAGITANGSVGHSSGMPALRSGEIGGFVQRADFWHPEISEGLQSGDAGIAIVGDKPAGLGKFGGGLEFETVQEALKGERKPG